MAPLELLAASILLVALAVPALAATGVDETTLISRSSSPDSGAAAGDSKGGVSISKDGRFVAFTSSATNLSADAKPGVTNIYIRDNELGTTKLVSRADGVLGAAADDDSSNPSITTGGRFVAFESKADNLSPDDDNSVTNVFLRDTVSRTTTLVSRAPDGSAADGDSHNPSVAGRANFVAYDSGADNLDADATPAVKNVFPWDRLQDTTKLISRGNPTFPAPQGPPADGDSANPSVSWNGERVAYQSVANNLSTIDNDAYSNIFVRDTVDRSTTLVTCTGALAQVSCPEPADGDSFNPSISPNMGFVAFESNADNLSSEANPAMMNVFLRGLSGGTTTLVSRASTATGAAAAGNSFDPSVSDDGQFVAFTSDAPNLTADDGATFDVFVRDMANDLTVLASRASGVTGPPASGSSLSPSISQNGGFVAFVSEADNLSNEDNDANWNVFERGLNFSPPPPPPPLPPPPPEHCHVPPCDTSSGGTGASTDHAGHSGTTAPGGTHVHPLPGGGQLIAAPGVAQTLYAPSKQRIGRLFVFVVIHDNGSFWVTGKIRMPGAASRAFAFKPVTRAVPAHVPYRVQMKLSRKAQRAVKRALKRGKRLKALVTSTVKDSGGAVLGSLRKTIRLKP